MAGVTQLHQADLRTVVFVEGVSDQHAVVALAERRGRDLASEGVLVVPMGGATNIGSYVDRYGPGGLDVTLAGLCDEAEANFFRRGLERAGLGANLTEPEMAAHGFYLCVADLEDELIRALGAPRVEEVLDAQGDLAAFRTFQQQPAQRAKPDEVRLRRFMGTRSGRKIHYASVLVHALDLARIPLPLDRLLAHI
jgi:hypothetical protein